MLRIWTGRVGKYVGADRVDITVKSGDRAFAPSWDMVMGYKDGRLSEDDYRLAYVSRMRDSYRANKARWLEMLAGDEITLLCYCKAGAFCHRVILAGLLVKAAAALGIEAEYCGERP